MSDLKVSNHLQSNYDNYYEDGDSEWRRLGAVDKANNIQSLCEKLNITSAIEIGAGEGSVLSELAARDVATDFVALEISPTGVATIKEKNIPGLKECSTFDGYNVPYENEIFDLAIMTHVIEHVEYPRKLIYEAARIAKHVFIEVPCEDNSRLTGDFSPDKVGHINFYSPKTIRRLLQTCNLEVINQIVTHPSRATYKFQKGNKGLANFYIKETLLKASPTIATALFTYNSSLICIKKQHAKID